jgi:hypothetical protein
MIWVVVAAWYLDRADLEANHGETHHYISNQVLLHAVLDASLFCSSLGCAWFLDRADRQATERLRKTSRSNFDFNSVSVHTVLVAFFLQFFLLVALGTLTEPTSERDIRTGRDVCVAAPVKNIGSHHGLCFCSCP